MTSASTAAAPVMAPPARPSQGAGRAFPSWVRGVLDGENRGS